MKNRKRHAWNIGIVLMLALAMSFAGMQHLFTLFAAAAENNPLEEHYEVQDLSEEAPAQEPLMQVDPDAGYEDAASDGEWMEAGLNESFADEPVYAEVEDAEDISSASVQVIPADPDLSENTELSQAPSLQEELGNELEKESLGYVSLKISCPKDHSGNGAVFGIYVSDPEGHAAEWTGKGFYTGADGTGYLTGKAYRQKEDPAIKGYIFNEEENETYSAEEYYYHESDQFYYYPSKSCRAALAPGVYVLKLIRALDPECKTDEAEEYLFPVYENQQSELDETVTNLLNGEYLIRGLAKTSEGSELEDQDSGEQDPEKLSEDSESEDLESKDQQEEKEKDKIFDDQEAEEEDLENQEEKTTEDVLSELDGENGEPARQLPDLDFSSCRLILGTTQAERIQDPESEVCCYETIYILQFADEETTRNAYAYYASFADFVEVDTGISIAEGEAAENVATDTVMTVSANPLSQLEKAVENSGMGSFDIALIDTGADGAEESVSMIGDAVEDENGHGTAMLRYIREYAPDASVLSVKALGGDGKGDVSAVYAAIQYAISRQVKIINLSISALGSADSTLIQMAVDEAKERGIIVVGAAGNNGRDARYYIPGRIPSALIVGASDAEGHPRSNSNYGETVDYLIAADSTSEAAAKCSGWLAVHGVSEIGENLNKGFIFDAQNPGLDTEDAPDDADDRFHIAELLYSGGTRISSTLKEDPALIAGLEPITPQNANYKSISFSNNWESTYWYVRSSFVDCRFLWLEPGYQTFQNTWYMMRGENGYDVKVTILNATNNSSGRSVLSVNTSPAMNGIDFGMLSVAQKLVDKDGNWIYKRENWLNGTYYEVTVSVDIYRHGTTERINAPTLYAAITDVDYGQRYKINNDPINISKAVIEDAAAFDQDNYHTGLYSYITSSGDIYSDFDRSMGMEGVPDNTNGKATVYSPVTKPKTGSLLMTFGYIRDAGSSILFYADSVHVYYRAEKGGTITGTKEELLARGDTASGTTQQPDTGYEFTGYTSNVNLNLSDGTKVTANTTVLTEDQVKKAIITTDTTFTAHYISGFQVRKIDADSQKDLKGAKLSLYDQSGKTLIESWTSDGKSHAVKGMETGKQYVLKEVSAPEKYKIEKALTDGVRFTYKADGSVRLDDSCEAVSVKNGVLTVVNTKIDSYSLTVEKTVSGGMANRYQDFDFTLTLTDSKGAAPSGNMTWTKSDGTSGNVTLNAQKTFTFQLRHGQNIKMEGIPEGSNYEIKEDTPMGYTVKMTKEKGTLQEDTTATFENHNEAAIPTGLSMDLFAGPALAAVCAAAIIAVLSRKQRKEQ